MRSAGKFFSIALNHSLGMPSGQRCLAVSLWASLIALAVGCGLAQALTDKELVEIRDQFAARRDSYLRGYLEESVHEIDAGLASCREGLSAAGWIWYPREDATRQAPAEVRYFRREFSIPASDTPKSAYCAFAADNYAEVTVNGNAVGQISGFQHAEPRAITRHLVAGNNVIEIAVHNAGDSANPAGLLGVVRIDFEQREPLLIVTDDTWRVTDSRPSDRSFAADWLRAELLGEAGCAPWGKISLGLEGEVNRYVFSRLTFALAALHLDTRRDEANVAMVEAVRQIRQEHQSVGEFGLHWKGGAFYRLYGLFGPGGTLGPRMRADAADAVWQLFADWARSESVLADSDPEHTWRLWGSENHSAQRDATRWAAARMMAQDPRGATYRYDDGSTPAEQLAAWRVFLKRYYRERIKRGMLVEISPSGYGSRTLQGWHNIYDFTDDADLKFLVKSALDVWWAEWAQEQLGGMRGGGKTRLYPGAWALAGHDRNRAMSWFYLGQGKPAHHHETLPVIATTGYRLPLVVMDIALDPAGRGVYECKSRRLGRHLDYRLSQSLSRPGEPIYDVDPEYGGIVRYSYCTPDFIIGSLMLEGRPRDYWTAISQQNRWHGVIFAGHEDSTLYPRCATDRSTYNAHWAVQNKGTLIAQKLRHSESAKAMRVCFSRDLQRHEEGGWIFARAAQAFAAVKIVQGAWQWEDKKWLRCAHEFTPVIIEAVRSADYDGNFQSFQAAVLEQTVGFEDGVLQYRGLQDSGDFTFYANNDRLPELNGVPIELAPDYTFESPFLNEDWASGIVRISKGDRELIVDVREENRDE